MNAWIRVFAAGWLAAGAAVFAQTQTQTVRTEVKTVTETQTVTQVEQPAGRLRAAIFLANRADKNLDEKLGVLNDMISARLTEKGFSILDRAEVMKKIKDSREAVEQDKTLRRTLASYNAGIKLNERDFEAGVEDTTDNASALRIAQMIGADYLVFANLTSLGTQTKKLKAAGTALDTGSEVTDTTLRVTLKVAEGRQGGSVYGDLVTVIERNSSSKFLEQTDTDLVNRLLDDAAVKIAEKLGGRVGEIQAAKPEAEELASFTVTCNLANSDVILDGAVIGTAGTPLKAHPGLHTMEINREWFRPWKRVVNLQAGQVINVQLELSEAGLDKFKNLEGYLATLERYKAVTGVIQEQSEADAYAKKKVAEGTKTFLENSSVKVKDVKIEQKNIDVINPGTGAAPVIIQNQNNK